MESYTQAAEAIESMVNRYTIAAGADAAPWSYLKGILISTVGEMPADQRAEWLAWQGKVLNTLIEALAKKEGA